MFLRHNSYSPFVPAAKRLFYRSVIEAHTIEKGLALPEPRPAFGRAKITGIAGLLSKYDEAYSPFPLEMTGGAISDYMAFNQKAGVAAEQLVEARALKAHLQARVRRETGGIREVAAPQSQNATGGADFIASRFSCRMFDARPVPRGEIEAALRVAQSAPSQCNRQATKVHVYEERDQIDHLLSLQGGAAGFASTVPALLLVTSELTAWGGPQQRNQPYVDGGLYSLATLLALHARGLASCPLNLAVTNRTERLIKRAGEVPACERLVMMIAVGYPSRPALRAAKSPRRPLAEIVTWH